MAIIPAVISSVLAARRTAVIIVGGLIAVLALIHFVFGPSKAGVRGIGLMRLLDEERAWRFNLWIDGRALNDVPLWEIQEGLALRANLSTQGVKGLLRRAANAADWGYRVEGHLLAGNTDLAHLLAGKMAEAAANPKPARRADQVRWLHRQADARWRGRFDDPVPVLNEAARLALERRLDDSAAVLRDLALWHWRSANMGAENPRTDLTACLETVEQLLEIQRTGQSIADRVAARRLQGRALLALACLPNEESSDALLRDESRLTSAMTVFEEALADADRTQWPDVWAAILHELAMTEMELAVLPNQTRSEDYYQRAADHLRLALKVRESRTPSGRRVDVRILERRLAERLHSVSLLSLCLSRLSVIDSSNLTESVSEFDRLTRSVLSMTLPDETGPSWITVKVAELLWMLAEKRAGKQVIERGNPDQAFLEMWSLAMTNFPLALEGQVAVPGRQVLFELLSSWAAETSVEAAATHAPRWAEAKELARIHAVRLSTVHGYEPGRIAAETAVADVQRLIP